MFLSQDEQFLVGLLNLDVADSLLVEPRPGIPSPAVHEELVKAVRKLVSAYPRLIYTEIEEELGISSIALNKI